MHDEQPFCQDLTERRRTTVRFLGQQSEMMEEAHVEVQAAHNKVTEAAFRVRQAMEEMSQIRKLLEANSEPASQ